MPDHGETLGVRDQISGNQTLILNAFVGLDIGDITVWQKDDQTQIQAEQPKTDKLLDILAIDGIWEVKFELLMRKLKSKEYLAPMALKQLASFIPAIVSERMNQRFIQKIIYLLLSNFIIDESTAQDYTIQQIHLAGFQVREGRDYIGLTEIPKIGSQRRNVCLKKIAEMYQLYINNKDMYDFGIMSSDGKAVNRINSYTADGQIIDNLNGDMAIQLMCHVHEEACKSAMIKYPGSQVYFAHYGGDEFKPAILCPAGMKNDIESYLRFYISSTISKYRCKVMSDDGQFSEVMNLGVDFEDGMDGFHQFNITESSGFLACLKSGLIPSSRDELLSQVETGIVNRQETLALKSDKTILSLADLEMKMVNDNPFIDLLLGKFAREAQKNRDEPGVEKKSVYKIWRSVISTLLPFMVDSQTGLFAINRKMLDSLMKVGLINNLLLVDPTQLKGVNKHNGLFEGDQLINQTLINTLVYAMGKNNELGGITDFDSSEIFVIYKLMSGELNFSTLSTTQLDKLKAFYKRSTRDIMANCFPGWVLVRGGAVSGIAQIKPKNPDSYRRKLKPFTGLPRNILALFLDKHDGFSFQPTTTTSFSRNEATGETMTLSETLTNLSAYKAEDFVTQLLTVIQSPKDLNKFYKFAQTDFGILGYNGYGMPATVCGDETARSIFLLSSRIQSWNKRSRVILLESIRHIITEQMGIQLSNPNISSDESFEFQLRIIFNESNLVTKFMTADPKLVSTLEVLVKIAYPHFANPLLEYDRSRAGEYIAGQVRDYGDFGDSRKRFSEMMQS
jgi:hypothetical protein